MANSDIEQILRDLHEILAPEEVARLTMQIERHELKQQRSLESLKARCVKLVEILAQDNGSECDVQNEVQQGVDAIFMFPGVASELIRVSYLQGYLFRIKRERGLS